VNQATLALLTDQERLARAEYEIGKATLQDALRLQSEAARVKAEIANLVDSQSGMAAQFKAALGIPGGEPAPAPPVVLESTPLNVAPEEWLQSALTNNTRIKALAEEVRSAEAAMRLAYKARMPDSSLGLMADVKANPVLFRPLATVTLPIWRDKLAAQLAEAQSNKQSAQARLSIEQINLAVEVAEKAFIYRETTRNLELFQGELLPKIKQSLEATGSGYLAGQADFLGLMDAERARLGLELDQIEARAERETALAELSFLLIGMPASGSTSAPAALTLPSKASGQTQGGMR
jgi:outer membrane protein TolC